MSASQAVFAYDPSAAERKWMGDFLGVKQDQVTAKQVSKGPY
jgi:hypothetical protein